MRAEVQVKLSKLANPPRFRELIEWHKSFAADLPFQPDEEVEINKVWALGVAQLANTEDLPPGFVAYLVDEISRSELQLLQTATLEAGNVQPS